jgi:hypothetical protein
MHKPGDSVIGMEPTPLVHVGYHKTGTTWLQQGLFADEQYGFTRVWPQTVIDDAFLGGNPFTFDPSRATELLRPFLERAAAAGTVPVVSHEPLSGLPTLNGFDSKMLADKIRATLPEARILIAIREQRSMMLSVYKQHITTSGTQSIGQMWRDHPPEERRRPTPGLDVFEYHHLIGYYQQLFGPERVLVLPFESLRADPVTFVKTVCSFAGVEPPADELPSGNRNAGNPALLVALLRYSNLVLRAIGLTGPFGGPIANERLRRVRYRAIDRVAPLIPKALSRSFDRRLEAKVNALAKGRYGWSNRITTEITGLSLASLGYDIEVPAAAVDPAQR